MDYHDSSAGTARLAVAKYAATVPKKLGTIFFHPGNPLHPLFMVSTDVQFSQADPTVQESRPSQSSVKVLVKVSGVPLT